MYIPRVLGLIARRILLPVPTEMARTHLIHLPLAHGSLTLLLSSSSCATRRHDLGRDAFLSKVWEWKETYGNRITTQIRSVCACLFMCIRP